MKKLIICSLFLLFILSHIIHASFLHKIVGIQILDDYTAVVRFLENTTQRYGNFAPGMECKITPYTETTEPDVLTTCVIHFTAISRIKE